jgi:hypothetical protein
MLSVAVDDHDSRRLDSDAGCRHLRATAAQPDHMPAGIEPGGTLSH